MKTLFLLDAFALIFRAYYALFKSPRVTSTGRNTNAQFGFTNALYDLIVNEKPSHMAVCFDTHAPTERHTQFEAYKANRQEAPEDLLAAIPDIKRIIKGFNIPVVEKDGFEADDVIGTLAKQAELEGYQVFMVTPDKDYGQLVTEKVKIYRPGYQGGVAEIYGPEDICNKWNIANVHQVIDMLGMMGDAVDNIPGIAGIGEKTAAKLLAEYGSLENVLENAHLLKGSLGEKVRASKEIAVLSKKLATIITDVPVQFMEAEYMLGDWNKHALKQVFTELEFKTIGRRLLGVEFDGIAPPNSAQQQTLFGNAETHINRELPEEQTPSTNAAILKTIQDVPHQYHLLTNIEDIKSFVKDACLEPTICIDTETTNIDANQAELVGLSFCWKPAEAWYIALPAEKGKAMEYLLALGSLFSKVDILWIGHNIKYDLLVLKWYGITIVGSLYDTMLAHYVAEPEGKRSMDALSEQLLQYKPISISELIGKKGSTQGTMRDVDVEKVKEYAAEDADITFQLYKILDPIVIQKNVNRILYQAELPLIRVLADMEFEGVKIDETFLKLYSGTLDTDAKIAETMVYDLAGVRFNLASPKQLGEVLFEKLKLDEKAKKTKTGQYQTGEDVLLKLAAKGYNIAQHILTFRELTKLKSTYVDALPQLINPKTGRVHTTYAQAVAVTGRLSSNNPNLQNIPVRTSRGREIRKAFVPRDNNHIIMSADYSQIELRIVAAISGDPGMTQAFQQGKDIHTATASKVYGIPETEVTKEQRYKAKSVNFGIIYGQGAFGLAENLGISRTEAKNIIDNYKREFSGIQNYMDSTVAFARENGYVETILGRKRWLGDIGSSNFTVRAFAERNAINSPIQGTAVDMIKLAMIKIQDAMQKEKMKSKMILQVHDELVFDAHIQESDTLKELILENMKTALTLPNGVPVDAECGMGNNWLEAH